MRTDNVVRRIEEAAVSICQVQFAIDDQQIAYDIVTALLDRHLVACAQQLGPIVSRYWWKGQQEDSHEWLVLLKTRSELSDTIMSVITEMHPYETPEVIVVPVLGGSEKYVQWVESETASAVTE